MRHFLAMQKCFKILLDQLNDKNLLIHKKYKKVFYLIKNFYIIFVSNFFMKFMYK
jgi:hypothetical protein